MQHYNEAELTERRKRIQEQDAILAMTEDRTEKRIRQLELSIKIHVPMVDYVGASYRINQRHQALAMREGDL
jgi:hypothetical protein